MATAIISKSSKKFFSNKPFYFKLITFPIPGLVCAPPKSPTPTTHSLTAPSISTSTSTTEYGKKEKTMKKEVLKDVFDHFDADKDGRISSKELIDYLASVGESVTHNAAKRVIREFDSDGDELLEYGDFVRLIQDQDNDESSRDDVLRSAFQMFEVDKGCGYITPKGLQQMLRRLGDVKSRDECAAMIRVFDLDGNGFLDFHEFQQMMSPPS